MRPVPRGCSYSPQGHRAVPRVVGAVSGFCRCLALALGTVSLTSSLGAGGCCRRADLTPKLQLSLEPLLRPG